MRPLNCWLVGLLGPLVLTKAMSATPARSARAAPYRHHQVRDSGCFGSWDQRCRGGTWDGSRGLPDSKPWPGIMCSSFLAPDRWKRKYDRRHPSRKWLRRGTHRNGRQGFRKERNFSRAAVSYQPAADIRAAVANGFVGEKDEEFVLDDGAAEAAAPLIEAIFVALWSSRARPRSRKRAGRRSSRGDPL